MTSTTPAKQGAESLLRRRCRVLAGLVLAGLLAGVGTAPAAWSDVTTLEAETVCSGGNGVYTSGAISTRYTNNNGPTITCPVTVPAGYTGSVALYGYGGGADVNDTRRANISVSGATTQSATFVQTNTGTNFDRLLWTSATLNAGANSVNIAAVSNSNGFHVNHLVLTTTAIPPADTTPPTAPGSFTATQAGTDVTLAWSAATDDVAVTGYQWRVDSGSWNTLGVTLTATASGSGYTDHTFEVRARDAAGNYSAAASVGYDGASPVDGFVPTADPEEHPRCSFMTAGYDSSFHQNIRVYVRCLTPSGAPTTWAALGTNRVSVLVPGWLTTEDRDAGEDPIDYCGIGQVDAWVDSDTTRWSTTNAEVSFLIGSDAPTNTRIQAGLVDCEAWAVGGGHSSITGGVGGLVGAANIVGNLVVGTVHWLGGEGFCYGTIEAGQSECTGKTGGDVILAKVTEASYPYEDGVTFPSLDPFGLVGGTSQHDPNVYIDTRSWNESIDGGGGTWGGGDFGGDFEVCGAELCFSNGTWGNGYGVGAGPAGYVPGSPLNETPDSPDPEFDGCDFSILDPGSYLCGLGGIFGKVLDVLRGILGFLQGLGSLLSSLFVPSEGAVQDVVDSASGLGSAVPFSYVGDIVEWTGDLTVAEDECAQLHLNTPSGWGADGDRITALDMCNSTGRPENWLVTHRSLLAIAVWVGFLAPLAWWAWGAYAPGSTGTA